MIEVHINSFILDFVGYFQRRDLEYVASICGMNWEWYIGKGVELSGLLPILMQDTLPLFS
jgi:hypothetical protein